MAPRRIDERKMASMRTLALLAAALARGAAAFAQTTKDVPVTLEFDQAQTAVLDGVNWDQVFPNERYFDAFDDGQYAVFIRDCDYEG